MNKRNNLRHFLAVSLFLFIWGVGTTATDIDSCGEVSFVEKTVVAVSARDTDDKKNPVETGGYQLV